MYIRTKDGVYKVSHYNDWATHKRKGATLIDGDKTSYIKNGNIIAQSENLEEVCDGFYIDFVNYKGFDKDKIGEPYTFEEFRDCFMAYRENEGTRYTHCEGYGFIKTNKGLIYVAKMDSEGKLVLI